METKVNNNQQQNQAIKPANEKEKINKVSAKRAVAQAKANGNILDKIAAFRANSSVGKGIKGQSVELYKKGLFAGLFDEEKKSARKRIRKIRDGYFMDIIREKDKVRLKKLCKEFFDWYVDIYTVNDFSVNSVCSGRTDADTKVLCEKALQIIKANVGK